MWHWLRFGTSHPFWVIFHSELLRFGETFCFCEHSLVFQGLLKTSCKMVLELCSHSKQPGFVLYTIDTSTEHTVMTIMSRTSKFNSCFCLCVDVKSKIKLNKYAFKHTRNVWMFVLFTLRPCGNAYYSTLVISLFSVAWRWIFSSGHIALYRIPHQCCDHGVAKVTTLRVTTVRPPTSTQYRPTACGCTNLPAAWTPLTTCDSKNSDYVFWGVN